MGLELGRWLEIWQKRLANSIQVITLPQSWLLSRGETRSSVQSRAGGWPLWGAQVHIPSCQAPTGLLQLQAFTDFDELSLDSGGPAQPLPPGLSVDWVPVGDAPGCHSPAMPLPAFPACALSCCRLQEAFRAPCP